MKIQPKNWKTHQHYNKRNPPWIKLHKNLLDDFDFQSLHDASKVLAMSLWLIASEFQDGLISMTVEQACYRIRTTEKVFITTLKDLVDKGFMFVEWEDASAVLARLYQSATPETETETETEEKSSTSLQITTEQKAKMMINDFRSLFSQNFGSVMPGGCNNLAHKLCHDFTTDKINEAFELAAKQGIMTIAYVEGILKGNGKPKQAGTGLSERGLERQKAMQRLMEA
jgi:DNA replication protein DnaD